LTESRKFITWELSSFVNSQNGLPDPFDCGVSQEPIHDRGEEGSEPTKKIRMGEYPIPKRPSLFVEVFRFSDEVQFGNIHAGRADHIAEMTTDA
jgi:hypothetical protein